VGILGVLRPHREGVGADDRHQQPLAEDVVQPRDREHDEAQRSEPVAQALERVEAQDLAARFLAVVEADAAAGEIEDPERDDHAEHEEPAEPGQHVLAEAAVIAPLRLLQDRGLGIRNADAAGEPVELPEELVLRDRACGGVRGVRLPLHGCWPWCRRCSPALETWRWSAPARAPPPRGTGRGQRSGLASGQQTFGLPSLLLFLSLSPGGRGWSAEPTGRGGSQATISSEGSAARLIGSWHSRPLSCLPSASCPSPSRGRGRT
jgi:hypothetical protein